MEYYKGLMENESKHEAPKEIYIELPVKRGRGIPPTPRSPKLPKRENILWI